MISLRSLAPIALIILALLLAPGAFSAEAEQGNAARNDSSGTAADESGSGKEADKADTKGKESSAAAAKNEAENQGGSDKGSKKFHWLKKSKSEDKDGEQKSDGKETAEAAPLSAAEAAYVAAAAERAKQLKSFKTPFNVQAPASNTENGGISLSAESGSNSLRSRLAQRLGSSCRVYLPGKLTIGKAAEFVIKGRAGSHAAIAMADKDSGAKTIFGQKLRLGADRKLMAAGTIPETGILTLIVDMPIQGDLIGLPVFFEAVVWQKDDFSDLEIATPVKSETAQEIADKANAIIVSGEKEQKRGLRFTPGSGVPLYQENKDSGRL